MKHAPIQIAKPGTFTASNGAKVTFTEGMLTECAQGYDPKLYDAPIVVGHPEMDSPAFGWIERLEFYDGSLMAIPSRIAPEMVEAVKAEHYKKVSPSFFLPNAGNNPKPGALYLRHVGFLGGAAPAIKSLRHVSLSDGDDVVSLSDGEALDFSCCETERWASLRQREQKVAHIENVNFVNELLEEVRIHPRHKERVLAFCDAMTDQQTVSFSEDGEAVEGGLLSEFKAFLSDLTPIVSLGEFAPGETSTPKAGIFLPAGYQPDPVQLDLHKKAMTYQNAHGVDYQTAVRAVSQ